MFKYGSEISQGNWNGMLGEVMDGTADFCIADISITSSRSAAFSFSMPWLNLGISILYIQPRAAAPSMLAFLDPFSTDVRCLSEYLPTNTFVYFSGLHLHPPGVCTGHPCYLCAGQVLPQPVGGATQLYQGARRVHQPVQLP